MIRIIRINHFLPMEIIQSNTELISNGTDTAYLKYISLGVVRFLAFKFVTASTALQHAFGHEQGPMCCQNALGSDRLKTLRGLK